MKNIAKITLRGRILALILVIVMVVSMIPGDYLVTVSAAALAGEGGFEAAGGDEGGDSSGDGGNGETSSGDSGGGETSSGDSGGGETSSGDSGGGETSSGESGGGETSLGDSGSGETSSGDSGGGETSSGDTGGGEGSSRDNGGGENRTRTAFFDLSGMFVNNRMMLGNGDSVPVTFTFTPIEGLEGAEVIAECESSGDTVGGIITDSRVTLSVMEDKNYSFVIKIGEVVVATSAGINVPDGNDSSISVPLTILAPTVSVSGAVIEFGALSATFTANVITLGTIESYRWYEGDVDPDNIIHGAEGAELIINDPGDGSILKIDNNGNVYICVVTTDAVLETGQGSGSLTVNETQPLVAITGLDPANESQFAPVSLTATVTGKFNTFPPVGNVEFFSGSNSLGESPLSLEATGSVRTAVLSDITLNVDGSPHALKAVFLPVSDDNYVSSASETISYSLTKAAQSKPSVNNPGTRTYGGADFSMTADDSGTAPVNGYKWSSSDTEVAEINETTGVVTIKKAGDTDITVQKLGNSNFNESLPSEPFTLTIDKADPVITWPAASLTYGTTLSDADLENGSASFTPPITGELGIVIGTFSFDESSVMPEVSNSNLTEYALTFSPEDDRNFNEITENVTIRVDKKELTVTADDLEIVYNGVLNFTVSFDGFVGEDNPESLAPGFEFPNVRVEHANLGPEPHRAASGEYIDALVPYNGEPTNNYTFIYVKGKLTVTPAEIELGEDYHISEPISGQNGWFDKEDIDNEVTFKITPVSNNGFNQITDVEDAVDEDWKEYLEFTDETADGNVTFWLRNFETKAVSKYATASYKIDTTFPVIHISYNNNDAHNEKYFDAGRTATITIIEDNFNPADVVIVVESKDINGVDQAQPALKDGWESQGNEHTAELIFSVDAIYDFYIEYTDPAGQSNELNDIHINYEANTVATKQFTVDTTAPAELKIKYDSNPFKEFVSLISFGLFFQDSVTVTVSAEDHTSGINEITYSYDVGSTAGAVPSVLNRGSEGSVTITEGDIVRDGYTHTASFNIPAQFKGFVTVDFNDRANNNTGNTTDGSGVVVDNIAPVMPNNPNATDGQVRLSPVRIVRKSDLTDIPSVIRGDSILYFNNRIVAEVTINEANFYPEDIRVTVEKREENNTITFPHNNSNTAITDWSPGTPDAPNDTHVGTLTLTGDGDYIITIDYTDKSGNVMARYTSERLTIDTKAPSIEISYDNNNPVNQKYFNSERVATITIRERNFRADEVDVTITATNVNGESVNIPNYSGNLQSRSSWSPSYDVNWHKSGDNNIARITFNNDANYTFAITYTDLARHSSTFTAPEFTIDQSEPTDLTITYDSNPILEFFSAITFNFFQPAVTVTLSANDATAGLQKFEYTYSIEEGASNINTGGSGELTSFAESGGAGLRNYSASFVINPQFRGLVEATATDMAGNFTDEGRRDVLIVDNIAPVITVTYDNNDVSNESFYNADRVATIQIEEANFDADDVIISVGTRNSPGESYTVNRVTPAFVRSGDIHTATVEFRDNLHYSLGVEYTDKSNNTAIPFETDEFSVDKIDPVIFVSYDNDSALNNNHFNADRIATITITEHNFNPDDVSIVGGATYAGAPVDFPALSAWTSTGDDHTATIYYTNDALYSLNISYTDMANNSAESYTQAMFYIDKTAPALHEDSPAKHGTTNIYTRPVDEEPPNSLEFHDTNINRIVYRISAYNYVESGFDKDIAIYELVEGEGFQNETEGTTVNIPAALFDENGVYEIRAVAYDLAGNDSGEIVHTKVVMREVDIMAYIPEDVLVSFNGIHMQAINFPDIPISIFVVDNEEDYSIYIGDTLLITGDYYLETKERAKGITEHIITIPNSYIARTFNEDDQIYDMPINISRNPIRTVGRMLINNVKPEGTFGSGLISGIGYYGVDEQEIQVVRLSEGIDVTTTTVNVNNSLVEYIYDATARTISFILGKSEAFGHPWAGHTIRVTLTDTAGNQYAMEEVSNVYVGNWFLRYWIFFAVGAVIFIGLAVFIGVRLLRKKED